MNNEANGLIYPRPLGVWVAAHLDRSGVYVFDSEIVALRFANSMGGTPVRFVEFGREIFEETTGG